MVLDENGKPIAEELDENGKPLVEPAAEPEALTPEEIADLRKKAGAFEDQQKRAEKAEIELKKLRENPTPKEKAGDLSPEAKKRFDRIELNSLGIKDREEQDYVLGAALRMGVEPSEAAADEFVAAKLEKMREAKKTKGATPPPNGGGQASNSVTRLAEEALKTGSLPSDPALKEKVRAEMKRISK